MTPCSYVRCVCPFFSFLQINSDLISGQKKEQFCASFFLNIYKCAIYRQQTLQFLSKLLNCHLPSLALVVIPLARQAPVRRETGRYPAPSAVPTTDSNEAQPTQTLNSLLLSNYEV